jgi:outer membrane protein TolC
VEAPQGEAPFPGAAVLDRRALVEEVLLRNPSLESARQAWRAALERFPQETSLDDPMFGTGIAPGSFGSSTVSASYSFELSQAFPFPGKLALRGEAALAEAEAADHDYEAARLRIATMASTLFDEYYLASRAIVINDHHVELLRELQRVALSQYEAGTASQQDPLQAESELAMLQHRQIELETQEQLAAAQIDALLHRAPDGPLPPPPKTLAVELPTDLEPTALAERAVTQRPELRAAAARVEARASKVALARREFLPDFTVWARYDTFWQERDLEPSVGFSLNLPLELGRRRAALEQANAELARAQSEEQRAEDQIRLSVTSAALRVHEAHHLLELTRDRLLPAARDRLAAARASYQTGQTNFLSLIDAERGMRDAELSYEEAVTTLSRRRAELDRATGRLPVLSDPGGNP